MLTWCFLPIDCRTVSNSWNNDQPPYWSIIVLYFFKLRVVNSSLCGSALSRYLSEKKQVWWKISKRKTSKKEKENIHIWKFFFPFRRFPCRYFPFRHFPPNPEVWKGHRSDGMADLLVPHRKRRAQRWGETRHIIINPWPIFHHTRINHPFLSVEKALIDGRFRSKKQRRTREILVVDSRTSADWESEESEMYCPR